MPVNLLNSVTKKEEIYIMSPPALFIVKPVAVLGFSFWGDHWGGDTFIWGGT